MDGEARNSRPRRRVSNFFGGGVAGYRDQHLQAEPFSSPGQARSVIAREMGDEPFKLPEPGIRFFGAPRAP